jgi:2-polyprenyl-6-hydroxyphenyl methylase/3-demethylubiquinone-9 3-methyltransferase
VGIPCLGLNGGPGSRQWAFSFQVATADQAETDRYWNAIVSNGRRALRLVHGQAGLSWQITPIALTKGITNPTPPPSKDSMR